jgi:putative transcriptional regulator
VSAWLALLARDMAVHPERVEACKAMSKAGNRILGSVRKAGGFARGEASEGFTVHVPEAIDVKAIRGKLRLSQEAFALRFGLSAAAVRYWEQGRRQPEQAARVLLMVIDEAPQTVERSNDARCAVRRAMPPSG